MRSFFLPARSGSPRRPCLRPAPVSKAQMWHFPRRTHRYHSGRYIRRREAALPEAVPLHSFPHGPLPGTRMFPVRPPRSGIRSARLSGCFPLHPGRGGSGNCRFCNRRREPSILYFHSAAPLPLPLSAGRYFPHRHFLLQQPFHLQCPFYLRQPFRIPPPSHRTRVPCRSGSRPTLFRRFLFPRSHLLPGAPVLSKHFPPATQSVSGFRSFPAGSRFGSEECLLSFLSVPLFPPVVTIHALACPAAESVISKSPLQTVTIYYPILPFISS